MSSRQIQISPRQAFVVAALGAYFLYFFGLGRTPLLDPDEPVYGQIAREMVQTGNWLTPHLAGRPWFDKPPLFYWVEAASMALLGPTELAARLPSALAAVLLALLVLLLGRRLYGAAAGWASAAVLATSLQTIILGRAAVTDMLFALTLMAAVGAFTRWYEAAGRSPGWAASCGAALGLGVLCKGPVALVLLGAAALAFLAWERKLAYLLRIDTLLVLICCLVVAGPWYGAMLTLNREAFVSQFIDANNLKRFSQSEHESGSSPFYFVPVLLGFMFPWCVFLLPAILAGRRVWAGRLLLCWTGVVFLFFSASSTKLVTYIYPLYPAAALLIGACLAGFRTPVEKGLDQARALIESEADRRPGRFLLPAAGVAAALGLVFALVLVILARKQYPTTVAGAAAMGSVLLAGTVWGLGAARRGRAPLAAYSGMMVGVAVVLAALIGPQVAPLVSLRELAIWEQTTRRPLVGFKLQAPGYLFYSGKVLPNEREFAGLAERIRREPDLVVAMSRRAVPVVAAAIPEFEWRVIWRRGNRVIVEPSRPGSRSNQIGSQSPERAQPSAALSVESMDAGPGAGASGGRRHG